MFFIHRLCFFFFKQKTAYEMRISDWSSDVCSSDLEGAHARQHRQQQAAGEPERMEQWQRVEHDVGRIEIDYGAELVAVGQDVGVARHHALRQALREIGRAACRERVCQYV